MSKIVGNVVGTNMSVAGIADRLGAGVAYNVNIEPSGNIYDSFFNISNAYYSGKVVTLIDNTEVNTPVYICTGDNLNEAILWFTRLQGESTTVIIRGLQRLNDDSCLLLPAETYNLSNTGGSVELDKTLSVEGKAADAKAVGDEIGKISEVTEITTKPTNLWTAGDVTVSRSKYIDCALPAGTYTLTADVESTYSSSVYGCLTTFVVYNETTVVKSSEFMRQGTGSKCIFTIKQPATRILIYAGVDYVTSAGYTATWSNVSIVDNNENTAQSITTAKDHVAREQIKANKIRLVKTGENLKINIPSKTGTGRYLQFGFEHNVNAGINLDTYRIKPINIVDANLTVKYALRSETEIEGVVHENGTSDYIGGYHGDESYEFCTVFVDGIEKPMDGSNYDVYCDTLDIVVKSTVNAVSDTNDKVFTRYKRLIFKGNVLTIENNWTALRSVVILSGYMTMFDLPIMINGEYIAKYCRNNINYVIQQTDSDPVTDSPFTATNGVNCIELWGDILHVNNVAEVDFNGNKSLTSFVSTEQTNTAKAYFRFGGKLEAGQKIAGKSTHTFFV